MKIPFGEFAPDRSDFHPGASASIINCMPTADGWGPLADLVEQSAALPAECIGACYVVKNDGSTAVYAGTSTNLYRLNTGTIPYSWDEISVTTDGYSVTSGDKWVFALFGSTLIATQIGNHPQSIDIESGATFGNLTTEFKARYLATSGDFVVFAHLDTASTGNRTVRWSGLNNATHWTNGRRGADQQIIPSGGEIMGILGDERGALIFQRNAIEAMQFAPASPYTFTFSTANAKRGVIAPYSITQIGQNQFAYLSEDGFFSGAEGRPIGGERVDRWFLTEIDRDYLFNVRGMADPLNKIIWWRYRNTSGENRLLGYDWQLDRWCYSDLEMTEAAAIATPAVSWDGLANLYASIDAISVPFDSPLFIGGKPVFGGFTSTNKLAYLAGANRQATLNTAFVGIAKKRSFVNSGRLIGDCDDFTVTPSGKDAHGDVATVKAAISPSPRSKQIGMRQNARLHSFKAVIAAGDVWKTVSRIDVEIEAAGSL